MVVAAVQARAEGGFAPQLPRDDIHVVRRNDTLWDIAREHGVSLSQLLAANPQIRNPHQIRPGQEINIPERQAARPERYTVRPDDTLSAIGDRFNVDWRILAQLNRLRDPDAIRPGQRLQIPPEAPAAPEPAQAPARRPPTSPTAAPGQVQAPPPVGQTGDVGGGGWIDPTGGGLRGRDGGGDGSFGASRRRRSGAGVHQGADYLATPGQDVRAPVSAALVREAAPGRPGLRGVVLRTDDGYEVKVFYINPNRALIGRRVDAGDVIGTAQDIQPSYGRNVPNHVHVEVRLNGGPPINPATLIGRTAAPAPNTAPAASPTPVETPAAPEGRYSPENLRLGANERYREAILEASQRTDMTPQTVAAIIDAEAAKGRDGVWNANSAAPTTSARGLTQFLAGTWRDEATRAGSLLNQEAKALGHVDARNRIVQGREDELLALRFNPRLSILTGADHAKHNIAELERAGLVETRDPAALAKYAYLAHHEGVGGAAKFLQGDMSYVRRSTFEANVTSAAERRCLLDRNGGDVGQAYREWLIGYVDVKLDVGRFMVDRQGVNPPSLQTLSR